jgi:AcrR family transcriptional regulator
VTKKKKVTKNLSTEEKIKASAKKLFTQKGFLATHTREIAEGAGINMAMLNYYFRSKQKLFDIVMKENLFLFLGGMVENIENNPRPFEEHLDYLVSHYIDLLLENPDLPLFVLSLMQSGKLTREYKDDPLFRKIAQWSTSSFKEIQGIMVKEKVKDVHPFHVVANMLSLIIFPFIASTLLMARSGNITRKEFEQQMIKRKKLIPGWIRSIMHGK